MKLTDLEPKWIGTELFVFKCPHCTTTWLSCKTVPMLYGEQFKRFREALLDPHGPHYAVVPMKEDTAWTLANGDRDFATMSVSPSIDASASGHWHGHITNGQTVP